MNLSNKEILEMILSANEEFLKKAQRMEELASQIDQSNQKYLSELKQTKIEVDSSGVKQNINIFRNMVENAIKTLERTQKGFNWVLYSVVFCIIGLASLFFTFWFGIKSKEDIRNEYHVELQKEKRILSKDGAKFYSDFLKWVEKNPKDSEKLFKKIDGIKR